MLKTKKFSNKKLIQANKQFALKAATESESVKQALIHLAEVLAYEGLIHNTPKAKQDWINQLHL